MCWSWCSTLRIGAAVGRPDTFGVIEVTPWDEGGEGVLALPSGRLVRGRALRSAAPPGPGPTFALVLAGRRPSPAGPDARWVRWRDFGVPADLDDAVDALRETWRRAADGRVEVGCAGGRGRTGTALAALAVVDGLASVDAVDWVRERYHRRAVETPWQRGWLTRAETRLNG